MSCTICLRIRLNSTLLSLSKDELVWNNLKTHTLGRKAMASRQELRALVLSHPRQMQKLPVLIRSFFRAPMTRYAALG